MNLYKILQVSIEASTEEIVRAYRKLAMIHHPDRGGDKETYQQITLAYTVLKDKKKREQYDNTGSTEPTPEDTMIRRLVIDAFQKSDNPVGAIIKVLKQAVREGEIQLAKIESNINKIKIRLAHFHELNPDDDVVGEIIDGLLTTELRNAKSIKDQIDEAIRVRKIFEGYRYNKDSDEAKKEFYVYFKAYTS